MKRVASCSGWNYSYRSYVDISLPCNFGTFTPAGLAWSNNCRNPIWDEMIRRFPVLNGIVLCGDLSFVVAAILNNTYLTDYPIDSGQPQPDCGNPTYLKYQQPKWNLRQERLSRRIDVNLQLKKALFAAKSRKKIQFWLNKSTFLNHKSVFLQKF